MARLESTGSEARRPMRTYPIENRQVSEVLGLLTGVLDEGVLEETNSLDDAQEDGHPDTSQNRLFEGRPGWARSGRSRPLPQDREPTVLETTIGLLQAKLRPPGRPILAGRPLEIPAPPENLWVASRRATPSS
jgi:hypothetical protein